MVAEALQAQLVGDGAVEVSGIASIPEATAGDLVFVEDEKHLRAAIDSRAAAVIVGKFATGNATKSCAKPLLIVEQPKLAFSRAAKLLRVSPDRQPGIHASAVVHASAKVGKGVIVAERACIGKDAEIGDGSWIGPGTVIGSKAVIGRNCELYPNVIVYPGVRLGDRVIVHAGAVLGSDGFGYVRDRSTGHYEKFPQSGRLEIGDDVEIGANSTIDRGALEATRIGRGVKIDNLVHVGHNCQIGRRRGDRRPDWAFRQHRYRERCRSRRPGGHRRARAHRRRCDAWRTRRRTAEQSAARQGRRVLGNSGASSA